MRSHTVFLALTLVVLLHGACDAEDSSGDTTLAQAKAIYSKEGPKTELPKYEKALAAYRQEGNQLFVVLSRAFLETGGDAMLASLWKVDDRSTPVMMSSICRAMKSHDDLAALSLAQRAMIADPRYHHPFYWAPFAFMGGEFERAQLAAEKH
jgi:hypothetical protein